MIEQINQIDMDDVPLWNSYCRSLEQLRMHEADKRKKIVTDVFSAAIKWLKLVPASFPGDTRHGTQHLINILDAIAGLLGDKEKELSIREYELLFLSTALHDIGLVYDDIQTQAAGKTLDLKKFIEQYHPSRFEIDFKSLDGEKRLGFLRYLHGNRISEVLNSDAWQAYKQDIKKLIPLEILLAVCYSHNQNWKAYENNEHLKIDININKNPRNPLQFYDPLFCALLLRLGDILDFDGRDAPVLLGPFSEKNNFFDCLELLEFYYPDVPSANSLPISVRCKDPETENRLRNYLDWMDEELVHANSLLKGCRAHWKDFCFPCAINRNNIRGDNYDSTDFRFTVDPVRILDLLSSENLYDSPTVFIRELLQNAIDATMLRQKLDYDFFEDIKEAEIHLWEWTEDGQLWFRIDDNGTGMTRRMLMDYLLKIGNSYYESNELKCDLKRSGEKEIYQGIGRFGIGFFSCFLCAKKVEVSTYSYDGIKCRRDNQPTNPKYAGKWGLRLSVPGLQGYCVLRNQAKNHKNETRMPMLPKEKDCFNASDGYRIEPGTTVAVAVDRGKLGANLLRDAVFRCLCAPKVPVYYHSEDEKKDVVSFPTFDNIIEKVCKIKAKADGIRYIELSEIYKNRIRAALPGFRGPYPRIAQCLMLVEDDCENVFERIRTKDNSYMLGKTLAMSIKWRVEFKKVFWRFKDQEYTVDADIDNIFSEDMNVYLRFYLYNKSEEEETFYLNSLSNNLWDRISREYDRNVTDVLDATFRKFEHCPSGEDLGESWSPFAGFYNLSDVWKGWVDTCAQSVIRSIGSYYIEEEELLWYSVFGDWKIRPNSCYYRGLLAGSIPADLCLDNQTICLFLDGEKRPNVDLGRQRITKLPNEAIRCLEKLENGY